VTQSCCGAVTHGCHGSSDIQGHATELLDPRLQVNHVGEQPGQGAPVQRLAEVGVKLFENIYTFLPELILGI